MAVGGGPTEGAGFQGLLKFLEERGTENAGEDADEEQEAGFGRDPSVAPRAESPAGDDAVEVRVVGEGLGPGMEDRREADAGAEVFGASGDVLEGVGGGTEE
jgi:hypothetical protein